MIFTNSRPSESLFAGAPCDPILRNTLATNAPYQHSETTRTGKGIATPVLAENVAAVTAETQNHKISGVITGSPVSSEPFEHGLKLKDYFDRLNAPKPRRSLSSRTTTAFLSSKAPNNTNLDCQTTPGTASTASTVNALESLDNVCNDSPPSNDVHRAALSDDRNQAEAPENLKGSLLLANSVGEQDSASSPHSNSPTCLTEQAQYVKNPPLAVFSPSSTCPSGSPSPFLSPLLNTGSSPQLSQTPLLQSALSGDQTFTTPTLICCSNGGPTVPGPNAPPGPGEVVQSTLDTDSRQCNAIDPKTDPKKTSPSQLAALKALDISRKVFGVQLDDEARSLQHLLEATGVNLGDASTAAAPPEPSATKQERNVFVPPQNRPTKDSLSTLASSLSGGSLNFAHAYSKFFLGGCNGPGDICSQTSHKRKSTSSLFGSPPIVNPRSCGFPDCSRSSCIYKANNQHSGSFPIPGVCFPNDVFNCFLNSQGKRACRNTRAETVASSTATPASTSPSGVSSSPNRCHEELSILLAAGSMFGGASPFEMPSHSMGRRELIKPSRICCRELHAVMPSIVRQIHCNTVSRKALCKQLCGRLYLGSPKPSPNFLLNTLLPIYRAADMLRFSWADNSTMSLSHLRAWVCQQRVGRDLVQQFRILYNAPTGKDGAAGEKVEALRRTWGRCHSGLAARTRGGTPDREQLNAILSWQPKETAVKDLSSQPKTPRHKSNDSGTDGITSGDAPSLGEIPKINYSLETQLTSPIKLPYGMEKMLNEETPEASNARQLLPSTRMDQLSCYTGPYASPRVDDAASTIPIGLHAPPGIPPSVPLSGELNLGRRPLAEREPSKTLHSTTQEETLQGGILQDEVEMVRNNEGRDQMRNDQGQRSGPIYLTRSQRARALGTDPSNAGTPLPNCATAATTKVSPQAVNERVRRSSRRLANHKSYQQHYNNNEEEITQELPPL